MKKNKLTALFAAGTLALSLNASAQDIVAEVQQGCASEIEQYCSQVMPGEGRLLACFYAFEDKLSEKCQYSLYEAASQLEAAVVTLNYFADQCGDDITKLCANVEPGEGRILECLSSQSEALSQSCSGANAQITE